MVNVGFSWGSLIGIVLAVAGAALYFLRSVRPGLARDYDIFFAAVGLLCGGILFFNSWRLDPILQFSQFLLAGSTIFFAYESIRLRGVATEQAKRSAPPVSYEDDRPVSRVYRAELDELEPPPPPQPFLRRIRGTDDGASAGPGEYGAYGGADEGRGSRRRPPSGGGGGRPVRSRPPVDGTGGMGDGPRRRPPGGRPEVRPEGRPSRSPRSPLASDGWDQEDVTEMPPRSPSGRPARGPERGPERGDFGRGGPERAPRRSGPPQGDRPSVGRPRERMERPAERSMPPRSPRVSLEDVGTPYLDEEEPPIRPTGRPAADPVADEPYVDYQPLESEAVAPLDLEDRPERSPQAGGASGAGGRSLDLGTPPVSERSTPERGSSERGAPERPRSSRMASALDEDDYDEEYGDRYGDPYGDDDFEDGGGDRRATSYGAGGYDLDADDDLGDDFGRPPRDR